MSRHLMADYDDELMEVDGGPDVPLTGGDTYRSSLADLRATQR